MGPLCNFTLAATNVIARSESYSTKKINFTCHILLYLVSADKPIKKKAGVIKLEHNDTRNTQTQNTDMSTTVLKVATQNSVSK